MQARMFSHDLNLSLVLHQMAFQVKFLAARKENSSEIYMQETSTMFRYSSTANSIEEIVDGLSWRASKLTAEILQAMARDKGLSVVVEDIHNKDDNDKRIIFTPVAAEDAGVLIIRDRSKECYCPVREKYISSDPHIAQIIYALLETNDMPQNMPAYEFERTGTSADGRPQFMLKVKGTREEIICFTDALIAIANKQEMKLAVHTEEKDVKGSGLN